MKLDDNKAVADALEKLRKTIKSEKSAGRIKCSMWTIFAAMDDGVTIIGEGCNCEVCTMAIAVSAMQHHVESRDEATQEWAH